MSVEVQKVKLNCVFDWEEKLVTGLPQFSKQVEIVFAQVKYEFDDSM